MPSLLQSISELFSGPKHTRHMPRDQAILSVDDAFTIPPDTEYVTTNKAYTYPPPAREGSYDTVPTSAFSSSSYDLRSPLSTRLRASPLLPTSHSPLSPLPPYPSLNRTWTRLRNWLDTHYPELGDTLNYGIPPADLAQLELQLGFTLPQAVRESYLLVDGQEPESSAGCSDGLFFGLTLLPLEDVVEEWRFWREVDEDPATGANPALKNIQSSIPPGWVRREYSQRGWLPLVADKGGNYMGIDMNPDAKGAIGQLIVFGRDFDTKVVLWRGDGEAGWAKWLASFVEELEAGEGFELGGVDGSEGSEDDVGYESYFFDGSAAKGSGGDSGGGGIRLTGEYKGWPVLEALADRSMRRWIEAGIMPPIEIPTASTPEAGPSGIPHSESEDEREHSSHTPKSPQSNGDAATPTNTHVRRESTTKVPAPQPISLPTTADITPSPDSSPPLPPLPDDDIEAALSMREFELPTPVQATFANNNTTSVPSPIKKSSIPAPISVPLPSETLTNTRTAHPVRQVTDPDITDEHGLLGAVTPAESPVLEELPAPVSVSASKLREPHNTPQEEQQEEQREEEEEPPLPEQTIRLVSTSAKLVDDETPGPLESSFVLDEPASAASKKSDSIGSMDSSKLNLQRIDAAA